MLLYILKVIKILKWIKEFKTNYNVESCKNIKIDQIQETSIH